MRNDYERMTRGFPQPSAAPYWPSVRNSFRRVVFHCGDLRIEVFNFHVLESGLCAAHPCHFSPVIIALRHGLHGMRALLALQKADVIQCGVNQVQQEARLAQTGDDVADHAETDLEVG